TGTLAVSQWTALTYGRLTIEGGDYAPTSGAATADNSFANLSNINSSSVYVYGGGSLTLPAVTSYSNNNGYQYFQADQYAYYDYSSGAYYGAGSVGVLSLPALDTISAQYLLVLAGGTGSEVDLPALTSFSANYYGALSVTSDATIE